MLASKGSFTYEDHGTPWSTAARDLRISISRGFVDTKNRGRASFADSLISIQSYEPFHAGMDSMFTIEGGNLQFSRLDLLSEGARSAMTGSIDMAHWPEQTYRIRLRKSISRRRRTSSFTVRSSASRGRVSSKGRSTCSRGGVN